jgi:hypothetical protein
MAKQTVAALNQRVDDVVDDIKENNKARERVKLLEFWRDGNGSKGAEERLQYVEGAKQDINVCEATTNRILRAIEDQKNRPRATFLKVKDWVLLTIAIIGIIKGFIL